MTNDAPMDGKIAPPINYEERRKKVKQKVAKRHKESPKNWTGVFGHQEDPPPAELKGEDDE